MYDVIIIMYNNIVYLFNNKEKTMQEKDIKQLLEQVKNNDVSVDEAADLLRELPYKDMGFANIDNHRALRTGYPEVIFCQGKTQQQIRDIMVELVKKGGTIMGTRATATDYEAVKEAIDNKHQAIILLNRRGHNTYITCSSCGYIETCPNCSVSCGRHPLVFLRNHLTFWILITIRLCN